MRVQVLRSRQLIRLRRDEAGVTAIEFAILAPVFLLMVMGIAEVGLMMGARSALDNAVAVGARTGKTGYKDAGKTQEQMILAAIQKASSSVLDPAKVTLKSLAYDDYGSISKPEPFTDLNNNGRRDSGEPFTDVNGNGSYDSDQGKSGYGQASEIVVYTASYPWKTFTPMLDTLLGVGGTVTLNSSVVVKNEPY